MSYFKKQSLLMPAALGLWIAGNFNAAAQQPIAQTAREKAEKRLAELLQPGAKADTDLLQGPTPRNPPRSLDAPEPILAPTLILPPRPPAPQAKPGRPSAPKEDSPLAQQQGKGVIPAPISLPTKPLVRLWSPDVNQPLPLPILGQPFKDRASLADVSLEASVAAALLPFFPVRTSPVPFLPIGLPDPFELSRGIQLRTPPEENPHPPVIPIRPPSKTQ